MQCFENVRFLGSHGNWRGDEDSTWRRPPTPTTARKHQIAMRSEVVDGPIVAAHENRQFPRAVLTITLGDGALPAAFRGGQIKCRCSEEATSCLCSEGAGRRWAECLVNGLRIDWQDVRSSSERVQLDYCHARHPQCRHTDATVTPSRSTYNTSAVTRLPRQPTAWLTNRSLHRKARNLRSKEPRSRCRYQR